MKRFSFVTVVFGLLVAALPAGAGDGVKLVKQPTTFPIVISAPGSYRLKGNLTVPNENTTAISVQADYVTIDLNGYGIQGPVTCTGSPVTSCSPSGTGIGIDGGGHRGVTARNGSVHGMGNRGIYVAGRVENVTADGNGESGIYATTVTGSVANGNGGYGIVASTVSNCNAYGNALYGIEGDGTVSNCTANTNGAGGIYASAGSVINSTANGNSGFGIAASNGTVSNCTAQGNSAGGIAAKTATGCTAQFNGGSQISGAAGIAGHNICGDPGTACP